MNAQRVGLVAAMLALLVAVPALAAADQVIFVVRHAERADTAAGQGAAPATGMMGADPSLSAAGHERAERLATVLAAAGVKQIITTEYQRTRQTAAPLAAKMALTPIAIAAKDLDAVVAKLRGGSVTTLVVGHSNTLPELLRKLGVADPVTVGENDYDDLFAVVRDADGHATLIRLKY
jgi:phosphohistidine phosphatase SixA